MYTIYNMKKIQEMKRTIVSLLLLVSILTLANTVTQNAMVWYAIDVFYFLIPLTFSLTYAKIIKKWNIVYCVALGFHSFWCSAWFLPDSFSYPLHSGILSICCRYSSIVILLEQG